MTKAGKRKKTTNIGNAQPRQARKTQVASPANSVATGNALPTVVGSRRRARAQKAHPLQDLIFPIMVALGCWGMAFSLAVFYTDPNRLIFAGMAVLMGLLWTFNAVTRIRKVLLARQQGM